MRQALAALILLVTLVVPAYPAANDAAARAALADRPWRAIGPANMGGRINDFAVVESDPNIVYIAAASGGLWKTTNHGTTIKPVFDQQESLSIGDVTVAPSDPNTVWVGTGEANNRQSSSWGLGVLKSTDGGDTWTHMGLKDTMHIPRIVIHPADPNTVYVAALGHLWGANSERGVYKTTDGGKTWNRVLYINDDTGCTDIVIDPKQPDTLYAAMYQRRRALFGFVGAGPGSGLFKSTDGGANWSKLVKGLPDGDMGRIGVDVYRKDPRIVYAVVEAKDSGVFRSEDSGTTWTKMGATNPRPMYFSQIRIDPNDDKRLWLAGVNFTTSTDSGKTFRSESGSNYHSDIHGIWIDPANSRHMLLGTDGGIQWSHDQGKTWDFVNTIPLAQFYAVSYDMRKPYWVSGGLQDNGTWASPSATGSMRGPDNSTWFNIGGGDGFYTAMDPTKASTVYTESQDGAVQRQNLDTGESKSIRPRPGPGEPAYRFDWNTPILISPHRSNKVFVGANRLFISTDRGDTWRRTDDLTTNPTPGKLPIMGKTGEKGYPFQDIPSSHNVIVTVSESPLKEGVIYVGTDDGNLQVSRDDGKTWKNVASSVGGVPRGTYVSRVHASAAAPGRVYACFDGHRSDDFHVYAFVSDDFGDTWRSIGANIPEGACVNVLRDHPRTPGLLFAGTERGLWISVNSGATWVRPGAPLPNVRVDDLHVHPRDNDLILGTHGRGVYVLDDITGIEMLAREPGTGTFLLAQPRPAVTYRRRFSQFGVGNRAFASTNAPVGAGIHYTIYKEPAASTEAKVYVYEKDGKTLVRTFPFISTDIGPHRTTWDMRYAAPGSLSNVQRTPPARATTAAAPPTTGQTGAVPNRSTGRRQTSTRRGGLGNVSRGPLAAPGTYIVVMQIGAEEQRTTLTIEEDPRLDMTASERKRHFTMVSKAIRLAATAREAESSLRALATPLKALSGSAELKKAPAVLQKEVADLSSRVGALLGSPSQPTTPAARPAEAPAPAEGEAPPQRGVGATVSLAQRASANASAMDAITEVPSESLRREASEIAKLVGVLDREAKQIIDRVLPALNTKLKAAGQKPIVVDTDDIAGGPGGTAAEEQTND